MYKNKEKQREANKESAKRYRKGMTQGMTVKPIKLTDSTRGMTEHPDILDKLTNPFWRGRLEKICQSFKSSHQSSYSEMCWLGDTNLSVACDYRECTA